MSLQSFFATQSDRFWDRIAARYARSPIADEAAYQHKLSKTREYLKADMEVLELGCGTGSTALLHAPYVKHIRATDLSEKMLEIARDKAAKTNANNITFEQATVEDLQTDDNSVDVILTLSLLHLLKDRHAGIAKIYKTLKPGGVFVSSTVCLKDYKNPIKYVLPLGSKLGLLPTVKTVTKQQLEDEIKQAGFEIEYVWQPEAGAAAFIIARKV